MTINLRGLLPVAPPSTLPANACRFGWHDTKTCYGVVINGRLRWLVVRKVRRA